MTRNKYNLLDYKKTKEGFVTFGDGEKGRVIGVGTLVTTGLPTLQRVMHVEGLKANLLSISQLCDQNLSVRFFKYVCFVYNNDKKCALHGIRSSDNCYKLMKSYFCNKASLNATELWHQRLCHVNYRTLTKVVNTCAITGVPRLSKKLSGVCRPCELGKKKQGVT